MLWAAIRATQDRYPNAICVVYTGDHEVDSSSMLNRIRVNIPPRLVVTLPLLTPLVMARAASVSPLIPTALSLSTFPIGASSIQRSTPTSLSSFSLWVPFHLPILLSLSSFPTSSSIPWGTLSPTPSLSSYLVVLVSR